MNLYAIKKIIEKKEKFQIWKKEKFQMRKKGKD